MNPRTTKPRQHEHCGNGRSGRYSRQHRNLEHPQPSDLARALRHAGPAKRFILTELRCPTCEARPLPLPLRPGMLPRCLRFNQGTSVDLVNLEVRDRISAKAIDVVCWGTGLQIVQSLWNWHTALAVMSERWCLFSTNKQDVLNAVTAATVIEKSGLHNLRKREWVI